MSGFANDPPGQPANSPQPYGSMPPPSEAEQRMTGMPTAPVPAQVDKAAKTLLAIAAYGVLSALISFAFNRDSLEDAIRKGDATLSDSDVSSRATASVVIGFVIALAFGALYYVCANKMRQARGWARVTPTVLIALGTVFGLISLSTTTGLSVVLSTISLVLGIAFLVFAWSKPSNEFFASARRPR